MNPNKLVYSIVKSFLIIAGLVALFNLIIISKPLIGYISLSIVVSLIGRPIKNLLVNKVKMNHLFSTIVTFSSTSIKISFSRFSLVPFRLPNDLPSSS